MAIGRGAVIAAAIGAGLLALMALGGSSAAAPASPAKPAEPKKPTGTTGTTATGSSSTTAGSPSTAPIGVDSGGTTDPVTGLRTRIVDATTPTPIHFAAKFSGNPQRWPELTKVNPNLTLTRAQPGERGGLEVGDPESGGPVAEPVSDSDWTSDAAEKAFGAALPDPGTTKPPTTSKPDLQTLTPWKLGQYVVLPPEWVIPTISRSAEEGRCLMEIGGVCYEFVEGAWRKTPISFNV